MSARAHAKQSRAKKTAKHPRISRQHKPDHLSLEEWQRQLRRQFGRDQSFGIKNLGEIFEKPDTKVVLFSQWLRMHQVIEHYLGDKNWDHVLFHGGVPGPKRKELVDRFRDDPDCRLFLATDAGGVGLNLQFASVVINMDLPWNPAVLEQRIGRVHRLG